MVSDNFIILKFDLKYLKQLLNNCAVLPYLSIKLCKTVSLMDSYVISMLSYYSYGCHLCSCCCTNGRQYAWYM